MVIKENIEGKRIYLASHDPMRMSEAYVQWMQDSDVLRYLDNPEGDYSQKNLQNYVSDCNASTQDYFLGIFLKESNAHIGNIKIGNIHPKHHRADIGIIIGEKKSWGQGYATEAIGLCVDFSFKCLRLHKLYAGMIQGNEGSYKPFLKAGFVDGGYLKDHFVVNGKYCDGRIVEMISPSGVMQELI